MSGGRTGAVRAAVPPREKADEGLRAYIEDHGLQPGDRLPGERELCETIGVSRTALREGLARLRTLSIIESRQGSGTYVGPRRPVNVMQDTYNYSEAVRAAGRVPSSLVVAQEFVTADEDVAEHMEVEVGAAVFHLCRVRLADGEPLIIEDAHVNAELCPGIDHHDFAHESLYEVLYESYGVKVEHSFERVTVGRMTEQEADLLHAEEGTPVLVLTGIENAMDDTVVEYVHSVIPPSRYRLANLTITEGDAHGGSSSDN